MLKHLSELRNKLDNIILKCMHDRIILYGYGYTGRFLRWYADYYHSIKMAYLISTESRLGQSHDEEIYAPTLLGSGYKDVERCVIWLAHPLDEDLRKKLETNSYVQGISFFDFYGAIYGDDIFWRDDVSDVIHRHKTGMRDIQFLEYLEWKYDCNFVTAIESSNLTVAREHGASYRVSDAKELFPILDKCHIHPCDEDAIFDFGCGKGGALVMFLDYGFRKVGGVEYEPEIYSILENNMKQLQIDSSAIKILEGDAGSINAELDDYNWFYFYNPFDETIVKKCFENLCISLKRKKRNIYIISRAQFRSWNIFESSGNFRLINEFSIDTKNRIIKIFKSI